MSTTVFPKGFHAGAVHGSLGSAIGALLQSALLWPSRVHARRKLLRTMSGMSDYELADIGLIRQDLTDSAALPLPSEPGAFFSARIRERRRRI